MKSLVQSMEQMEVLWVHSLVHQVRVGVVQQLLIDFSDGVSYIDGETFYSETAMEYGVGGTDADDSDPNVW